MEPSAFCCLSYLAAAMAFSGAGVRRHQSLRPALMNRRLRRPIGRKEIMKIWQDAVPLVRWVPRSVDFLNKRDTEKEGGDSDPKCSGFSHGSLLRCPAGVGW
jgi:hypothetical protein